MWKGVKDTLAPSWDSPFDGIRRIKKTEKGFWCCSLVPPKIILHKTTTGPASPPPPPTHTSPPHLDITLSSKSSLLLLYSYHFVSFSETTHMWPCKKWTKQDLEKLSSGSDSVIPSTVILGEVSVSSFWEMGVFRFTKTQQPWSGRLWALASLKLSHFVHTINPVRKALFHSLCREECGGSESFEQSARAPPIEATNLEPESMSGDHWAIIVRFAGQFPSP